MPQIQLSRKPPDLTPSLEKENDFNKDPNLLVSTVSTPTKIKIPKKLPAPKFGSISSSAKLYKETVLVISDLFTSVSLNSSNVGEGSVQVINLPSTTITRAQTTVTEFVEKHSHLQSHVCKIFVRLGTMEVLGQQDLSVKVWPMFPPLISVLKQFYPSAGVFLCSVIPVEDTFSTPVTRHRVTLFNSWLYALCNPESKIYYLNFYVMFLNQFGKNYAMFKDNIYLNEWGESMLIEYYKKVVQNELVMIV